MNAQRHISLIPAKAGIQFFGGSACDSWVPAFAGTSG